MGRRGVAWLLLAALLACVGLLAAAAGAAGQDRAGSFELTLLAQLNQIRAAHDLHPLALSPGLNDAAIQHTQEMVADGYFAHDSANGTPSWKRIRDYYPSASFAYWSVGENLFWRSGAATPTAGVKAWMASPGHRANILDPSWRQIGIASVNSPDAPGTYGGNDVTVITTDFGDRH
jgi:uncharacterized protein YkwD